MHAPPRRDAHRALAGLVAAAACAGAALVACHDDGNRGAAADASVDAGVPLDASPFADAPAEIDAGPYVPSFAPLDSDGHVMRDARGRTVILRGYNVKVEGLFDVTPDNGDPVRETIPPLDDVDFASMQANGVNVLRLPVTWSAFEPQQGAYQSSYLTAVDAFLDRVRPYGFYVLLDFHEDGWSKDLCEDGAPAWATVVAPGNAEGGAPTADCHASNAALSAHASFFDQNANDLQGAFAAMYAQFAAHFVHDDEVFAYEIFNEPISSDPVIAAFSVKVAQAIRQSDPRHLILWEPSALRNQLDQSMISSVPFSVPGCVYAVHVYTSRNGDWSSRLAASISNARAEADGWGEPLFITEHGADSDLVGEAWVDEALNGFDTALASSMDWIWNPGVVTRGADGGLEYVFDGGVLAHLTRPYAQAVGGDVTSTVWDGTSLTIGFDDHPGVPHVHDVFWNGREPVMTCDGKTVGSIANSVKTNVYTVDCGGPGSHTLVFSE